MKAVDQWRAVVSNLPEGWEEAVLAFTPEEEQSLAGAAAVLAPLGPGRVGGELRLHVRPSGPMGSESVRSLLARLDRKRIWGDLRLLDVSVASEAPSDGPARPGSLVESWEQLLAALPPDWSDGLFELRVDSSDYLPRAALLGAPLNPARRPGALALRFRVGRTGYGTSAAMARRCFERMDADGLTGSIETVDALSDVSNAGTLGPVWRIAGRAV